VSLPFEVFCLLSHGGASVIGILRTMWSSDQWHHSWSPTEFANSSRFTSSPVRSLQFAKYPHPTTTTLFTFIRN